MKGVDVVPSAPEQLAGASIHGGAGAYTDKEKARRFPTGLSPD